MQGDFADMSKNVSQGNATPASEYARTVVAEALKAHPRAWLWTARHSWIIWFMTTFLGRRAFDSMLSARFGLTKFAEFVRTRKWRSE